MDKVKSISSQATNSESLNKSTSSNQESRTNTEIAFERAKQKRIMDEMIKKPSKTHKERIMEFNQHLDNLSEHYDIPKVSWTK